jgi:RimJ/RimL family protein N-acetyltransferase
MSNPVLSVREMQPTDIELIIQYWLSADKNFLEGMGADIKKIPAREEWIKMLTQQYQQSYNQKQSYCLIWLHDGLAVGHSNVNKIVFGKEAYMHLHLWKTSVRQKGMGAHLVKMGLPYFFNNLQLQKLYCEPYALNTAPNKTLQKVGFTFLEKYTTTPGWLNFEQEVNLWVLTKEDFLSIT